MSDKKTLQEIVVRKVQFEFPQWENGLDTR